LLSFEHRELRLAGAERAALLAGFEYSILWLCAKLCKPVSVRLQESFGEKLRIARHRPICHEHRVNLVRAGLFEMASLFGKRHRAAGRNDFEQPWQQQSHEAYIFGQRAGWPPALAIA